MRRGELRRRDLLAATLGLPLALTSCGQASEVPLPAGAIVGASHAAGHALRSADRPVPPEDAWTDAGVVVVGGGAAGLAAAWRLARTDAGNRGEADFTVLELEPDVGGTARSGRSPLTAYPWGAHYIPTPTTDNPALVTLLDEMGVLEGVDARGEPRAREQFRCRDPEERVFFKGRWYEGLYLSAGASTEDAHQLERFRAELDQWARWRDASGARAFAIPTALSSDDVQVLALDRETMASWMDRRGLTSPRLRWLVDYACRDDYGLRLEETSAWAGLFYFVARMEGPGEDTRPLITWPEGNGRLVEHLRKSIATHVRTGSLVVDVIPRAAGDAESRSQGPGVDVVVVDTRDGNVRGLRAQQVVLAAPQFLARHLIAPWRDSPPPHLASFSYSPWMVANLHLSTRTVDRGFERAWDSVLYDSPALGYVTATHQTGLDHGATVLTYYHPLLDPDPALARQRLLDLDREAWCEVSLSDLERAHPELRRITTRLDVMRWGHAMVRPVPGLRSSGALERARQPHQGIHFAGTDLSGIALFEEAFHHGVRAAEEVLAARKVPYRTML